MAAATAAATTNHWNEIGQFKRAERANAATWQRPRQRPRQQPQSVSGSRLLASSLERATAAAWQRPRQQPQPISGTRLVTSSADALMQQHGSGHGSGHGSSHNQSVDQGCSLRAWNVHNFYITSDDNVVITRSRVLAAAAASTSPQPRGRHATPLPPEGTSSRPDHGRGLQFM